MKELMVKHYATVDMYTDKYMRNEPFTKDDVAACVAAIDYIRSHGGNLPTRSIGMRMEYGMPLPSYRKFML